MKKIYEVDKLLKPIKITEQESTDKEAEEAQSTEEKQPAENNNKKTENTDDENTKQAQEKKPEEQEKKSEEPEKNQPIQDNSQVNQQQKSLYKMNSDLTNCAIELDNIYKNNNLKKYGIGVENAYKGLGRFIWPAIGISVAIVVAAGCMQGWIPVKKVLPKIPLIGKLFSGDKVAINTVQNSLIMSGTAKANQAIMNAKLPGQGNQAPQASMPSADAQVNAQNQTAPDTNNAPVGSNPEQKTDKAPTIANSIEAQSQAKPGDVIQRNNGERYVLNQGDIDWAKQQVQKGKGNETVDQAKQEEDTGSTIIPNAQNETAPDTNQQNNSGQTTTPANGNAQQTSDQNANVNNTAPQVNNQPDNNGQVNANQQTDNQQGESIKDTAQQIENAANSNANQPTNNTPTSNSTTVKNPDGSITTTTQNNNGQGSTGTTTTTTNGNTTTTTNVETQVGGYSATHGTPVTQSEAQTILRNNGLQTNNEKLNEVIIGAIVDNGLDKQEAIKVLSSASVSLYKIKNGKSSIDTERIFFRDGVDGNSPNMSRAFNQILFAMDNVSQGVI